MLNLFDYFVQLVVFKPLISLWMDYELLGEFFYYLYLKNWLP